MKAHLKKKVYKLRGFWGGGGFKMDDELASSEDENEEVLMHSKYNAKDRFGYEIERNELSNPYSQAQISLSDGIGYASAILPKEVLDELWMYNNQIEQYAIVLIKGKVVRYSYEDGKTAFIINEAPRVVVTDVAPKKIGDPVPLVKAFDGKKYEAIETKYKDDYFSIPYKPKFKQTVIEANNVPESTKVQSLKLRDRISTLLPH